jgi:hypothetical protein
MKRAPIRLLAALVWLLAALVWLLAPLVLVACRQRADSKAAAPAACKEFGQTCEYAPGKLGSCVVKDDCKGSNCFVCQSQH